MKDWEWRASVSAEMVDSELWKDGSYGWKRGTRGDVMGGLVCCIWYMRKRTPNTA